MSFILDALKKSESDRQRQTGPALFEVKIAPPKARFPVWTVAIAALLAINMVIVGWLLLRRPAHVDTTAAAAPTGAVPVTAPASATAPQPAPAESAKLSANLRPGTVQSSPPPPPPAVGPVGSGAPPAGSVGGGQLEQPALEHEAHEPTLANSGRDSGTETSDAGVNPDDYTPATDASGPALFKGHVRRGTESGLPLYQDAAVAPGSNLPQLRLDLHVYAAKPQDRFALINMHKLHEGDSLQDGVRVESITPEGVIMSYNGSKFLLPRD